MSPGHHTFDCFGRNTNLAALVVVGASLCLLLSGCSGKERYHSALVATDEDISRGTSRGKSLIASGADPADAYKSRMVDVNVRVSSDVILRSAGVCMPADEIAYQIALGGDSSDNGVRHAVTSALKTIERQVRTAAIVQVAKSRDPASVDFALRTSPGTDYPPIAVEKPTFLREVKLTYDSTAPAAALYSYVILFPSRGGPGVPPIGPTVSSLSLVVQDGPYEGKATFPLQVRSPR